MGKIFRVDGRIGFRRADEVMDYPLPDGATEVLEVDFDVNPDLLEALETDINSFRLEGGMLWRHQRPITIQPNGARAALRLAARSLNGKRVGDLTLVELRILVAFLAFRAGWIEKDGTLKIEAG